MARNSFGSVEIVAGISSTFSLLSKPLSSLASYGVSLASVASIPDFEPMFNFLSCVIFFLF